MYVIWRCSDETQFPSCFHQMIQLLTIDSSASRRGAVHSGWFLSKTILAVNPVIEIVCADFRTRQFSLDLAVSVSLFITYHQPSLEIGRFYYDSAGLHRWKFCPRGFFLLTHMATIHPTSFCIQPFSSSHMMVSLNNLQCLKRHLQMKLPSLTA